VDFPGGASPLPTPLINPDVLHLHTHFLFPISIDEAAVMEDHPEIWKGSQSWFEKLDHWVTEHCVEECRPAIDKLGKWRRSPESGIDFNSSAYQEMTFFHPFIRRAFFDTGADQHHEALVHRYVMNTAPGSSLFLEAVDGNGESAKVEIRELRLMIFANGIAILIIDVSTNNISYTQALWINEMMRKVYPSSGHQIETARIPNRMSIVQEDATGSHIVAEERWETGRGVGTRPQVSSILLSLLYFVDYTREEFEVALDERMVVHSFVSLDRKNLPNNFEFSDEYEIAFSRLLYVDRNGPGYRYDPHFIREQMKKQVYRRWQHQGTLYGTTNYSNVACTLFSEGADPVVHRMFSTKYLLLTIVALFYRATFLDFAKESALVSRQLFPVFSGQSVRHRHIQLATKLMADFHYFNNYWFHFEPTAKDEELEHFALLREAYQLLRTKAHIEDRIDKLAGYIDRLYALRNNDAVNRLAMMSVVLGIGALVTGYYGMNIKHLLAFLDNSLGSAVTLSLVTLFGIASLWFVVYIIASNWRDYRASILPHRYRKTLPPQSLRRTTGPENS
jgi:hypothetical protein